MHAWLEIFTTFFDTAWLETWYEKFIYISIRLLLDTYYAIYSFQNIISRLFIIKFFFTWIFNVEVITLYIWNNCHIVLWKIGNKTRKEGWVVF